MPTNQESPETLLWEYLSHNESATLALWRRLGLACQGGEIILLEGPLGAGKTRLAHGIGEGLGVKQPVISPTFIILRSYPGAMGLTLHHFDFYRLGGDEDLDTIGLEDCLADDTVVLAEWPGVCPHAFPQYTLRLVLEPLDEEVRRIRAYAGTLPLTPPMRELAG